MLGMSSVAVLEPTAGAVADGARRTLLGRVAWLHRQIDRIADAVATEAGLIGGGEVAEVDEELDRLSAREREVMRLIARGYQYKEVAKELFISVKTVETHVSSVLRKLQLSSMRPTVDMALPRPRPGLMV